MRPRVVWLPRGPGSPGASRKYGAAGPTEPLVMSRGSQQPRRAGMITRHAGALCSGRRSETCYFAALVFFAAAAAFSSARAPPRMPLMA
jgi:hypothetical protein